MDISTIMGFGIAIGLILFAMIENLGSFIDVKSIMIVVGGTVGAVIMRFPIEVLSKAPTFIWSGSSHLF